MPTYSYRCETCGTAFDRVLRIAQYNEPQICVCGQTAKKLVTGCNFNLPGDGWTSKNDRIAAQMRRKNQRLTRTTNEQKRDAPLVRLTPNVGGERVGSWSEAQKLASSQGKDTTSYEPMIRKETSKS